MDISRLLILAHMMFLRCFGLAALLLGSADGRDEQQYAQR